jgi:hypothetical protein
MDIDGVVADVRHRLHFIEQAPKDWDSFFAAAAADPPIAEGISLARELAVEQDLVWLTGRPQRLRRLTIAWLRANGLRAATVHMRPSRDFRKAARFKLDVVEQIAARSTVGIVVDDDPLVVETLRGAGFSARLVSFVPREDSLDAAQEHDGKS